MAVINYYDHFGRSRPAVHRLCHSAFLQESFLLGERTFVTPLDAIGLDHLVDHAAKYHAELFATPLIEVASYSFREYGRQSLPVVSIIHLPFEDAEASILAAASQGAFERAGQIISWVSGNYPVTFVEFIARDSGIAARVIPPLESRRLLLGFGNTGDEQQWRIDRILHAADNDERFGFALSLYRDALHEHNQQFQIARLFSVLEALAYALKDGVGSRTAVRNMIGLTSCATGEAVVEDGRKIKFERIELAGRLRDKLFHGVPFEASDLSAGRRDGFELIRSHPQILIDALKSDCEIEIARWANGASVARQAARASRAAAKR